MTQASKFFARLLTGRLTAFCAPPRTFSLFQVFLALTPSQISPQRPGMPPLEAGPSRAPSRYSNESVECGWHEPGQSMSLVGCKDKGPFWLGMPLWCARRRRALNGVEKLDCSLSRTRGAL